MSGISDYDDIARVQGHAVLLFERIGSYQGTWIMLSKFEGSYYLWQDWYGSCSGCDALEAHTPDGDEEILAFLADYKPFAIVLEDVARVACVESDSWHSLMPANTRDDGESQFEVEARLIVKLDLDIPLSQEEILGTRNQETRRHGIEQFGIAAFLKTQGAEMLDEDERHDKLMRFEDGSLYLWLQDGSTDREYILRVPPDTVSVLNGKAWGFQLKPEEYRPLIEA